MTVLLYTIDSPTNIFMLSVLFKFTLPMYFIIKVSLYIHVHGIIHVVV